MATTARREPRKVRRARRADAFYADRARKAENPVEQFRVSADAMRSAAKHTKTARTARDLREDVTAHVHKAIDRAGLDGARREFYLQKLTAAGSELHRLGVALMCLQGVIQQLPDTERDQTFEHYRTHFDHETHRINTMGGVR